MARMYLILFIWLSFCASWIHSLKPIKCRNLANEPFLIDDCLVLHPGERGTTQCYLQPSNSSSGIILKIIILDLEGDKTHCPSLNISTYLAPADEDLIGLADLFYANCSNYNESINKDIFVENASAKLVVEYSYFSYKPASQPYVLTAKSIYKKMPSPEATHVKSTNDSPGSAIGIIVICIAIILGIVIVIGIVCVVKGYRIQDFTDFIGTLRTRTRADRMEMDAPAPLVSLYSHSQETLHPSLMNENNQSEQQSGSGPVNQHFRLPNTSGPQSDSLESLPSEDGNEESFVQPRRESDTLESLIVNGNIRIDPQEQNDSDPRLPLMVTQRSFNESYDPNENSSEDGNEESFVQPGVNSSDSNECLVVQIPANNQDDPQTNVSEQESGNDLMNQFLEAMLTSHTFHLKYREDFPLKKQLLPTSGQLNAQRDGKSIKREAVNLRRAKKAVLLKMCRLSDMGVEEVKFTSETQTIIVKCPVPISSLISSCSSQKDAG